MIIENIHFYLTSLNIIKKNKEEIPKIIFVKWKQKKKLDEYLIYDKRKNKKKKYQQIGWSQNDL